MVCVGVDMCGVECVSGGALYGLIQLRIQVWGADGML